MSYFQVAEAAIEQCEETGRPVDHEWMRTLALMSIAESLARIADGEKDGLVEVVDKDGWVHAIRELSPEEGES